MKPVLSDTELVLFTSLLRHADSYLEFGSGGSTCLAAATVRRSVVTVDSSRDWMQRVAVACAAHPDWLTPELVAIDIGPLGDWGWPREPASRPRWPGYHESVWQTPERAAADMFMVDGRFRVACVMQILLRCRADAVICVHDFSTRADYHPIREVARELASADALSVFQRRPGQDDGPIRAMLERHRYEPR